MLIAKIITASHTLYLQTAPDPFLLYRDCKLGPPEEYIIHSPFYRFNSSRIATELPKLCSP